MNSVANCVCSWRSRQTWTVTWVTGFRFLADRMFGEQEILNIGQLHLFNLLFIAVDVDDGDAGVNVFSLHDFLGLETGVE